MDEAETNIWVFLTLYGGVALAIFATGLFALVEERYPLGVLFTVAGLTGVADAARRAKGRDLAIPNYVLAGMLMLTWAFFGYDLYDRHYHATLSIVTFKRPTIEQWSAIPIIKIVDTTFRNQQVILDGYEYVHCTFELESSLQIRLL